MRTVLRLRARAVTIVAALAFVASGCAAAPTSSGSTSATPGPLASIAAGDCLGAIQTDGTPTETVTTVSCTAKHHWEVTAVLPATGDAYPGEDALRQIAQAGCPATFTSYVGVEAGYSPYSASFLAPNANHWTNPENRRVACLAGSADVQLVASIANQAVVYPVRGQCTGQPSSENFSVTLIACSQPHYYEVYASTVWTGKKAPTTTEFDELYKSVCVTGFKKFVGIDAGKSTYEILHFMVPTKLWTTLSDHRIVCAAGSPTGGITGSLAGTKK